MSDLEYKPFKHNQIERDFMYSEALFKTAKALNMGDPRIPNLKHDLIECSVCHKLIESPDIEECEFCNEDVCDNCWDKHRCEEYDYE